MMLVVGKLEEKWELSVPRQGSDTDSQDVTWGLRYNIQMSDWSHGTGAGRQAQRDEWKYPEWLEMRGAGRWEKEDTNMVAQAKQEPKGNTGLKRENMHLRTNLGSQNLDPNTWDPLRVWPSRTPLLVLLVHFHGSSQEWEAGSSLWHQPCCWGRGCGGWVSWGQCTRMIRGDGPRAGLEGLQAPSGWERCRKSAKEGREGTTGKSHFFTALPKTHP